jgi:hypothetical protein
MSDLYENPGATQEPAAVYLIVKEGRVVSHTSLEAMKELDGVEEPALTVSMQEFEEAEGIARLIDGEIFLGKTAAEKLEEKEEEVRARREKILLETVDRVNSLWWESMPGEEKEAWRAYRQALLDIPEQEGYPFDVAGPVKPA